MNGANITSKLDGKISVGGITRVTFDLMGEVKRLVHFRISGNCFCRIRTVVEQAVAVIIRVEPSSALSSPEDKFIAGLNASLDPLLSPQLTTI